MPTIFDESTNEFKEFFQMDTIHVDNRNDDDDENNNDDADVNEEKHLLVRTLRRVLQPYILRRTREDIARKGKFASPSLSREDIILYATMSKMQQTIYGNIINKNMDIIMQRNNNITHNVPALRGVMTQQRKCTGHPYLFPGVEDTSSSSIGEDMVENCGKLIILDKLLKRLRKNHTSTTTTRSSKNNNGTPATTNVDDNQVVIYSHHLEVLDKLEKFLTLR